MIEKMQYSGLGKFIRYKRNLIVPKITLNNFAFNIELEPAILSRIENEKQDIKYSCFKKFSKGFSQKPSELLDEYEKSEFYR